MILDHRVTHLSTLYPTVYGDVHACGGPVIIQRVMLNHSPTTTPRGDQLCIVLSQYSCLGAHQFNSYSPSMMTAPADSSSF